jgi:hypothetical protein
MGEMSKFVCLIGWSSRDMWAYSLYFMCVVFGSICKTFASFQHFLWPWANFYFSSRPWVRMYLCSCVLLKVCLFRRYNICHNHLGCCTHTASSADQAFINVPQNVCLVLKMLRALKRFPVRLDFSEKPFNIWDNDSTRVYCVFIREWMNSCGYSLCIRSCLIFLDSML